MKTLAEIVSFRIKLLRVAQDLTIADAAKKCGLSTPVWGKIETGDRPLDLETIEKVSATLGVEPDALLEKNCFDLAFRDTVEERTVLTPQGALSEPNEPGWWWCCRPREDGKCYGEDAMCVDVEDGAAGWRICSGGRIVTLDGVTFGQMVWVKANNPWGENF